MTASPEEPQAGPAWPSAARPVPAASPAGLERRVARAAARSGREVLRRRLAGAGPAAAVRDARRAAVLTIRAGFPRHAVRGDPPPPTGSPAAGPVWYVEVQPGVVRVTLRASGHTLAAVSCQVADGRLSEAD